MGHTDRTIYSVRIILEAVYRLSGEQTTQRVRPISLAYLLKEAQGNGYLTRAQARRAVEVAVNLHTITVETSTDPHGDQRLKWVTLTAIGHEVLADKPNIRDIRLRDIESNR